MKLVLKLIQISHIIKGSSGLSTIGKITRILEFISEVFFFYKNRIQFGYVLRFDQHEDIYTYI